MDTYDTIIIGGGFAGLQAAIQLGRYRHDLLVIDAGYGRSTLCRSYHNLLGWPEGVSGDELRRIGRGQAQSLGVSFMDGEVTDAFEERDGRLGGDRLFRLKLKSSAETPAARTLLLATGVMDRFPILPGLIECLGSSVYVCPDCDGHETADKRTVVLGSGDTGARMALTLLYWTKDVVYVNHERKPINEELKRKLEHRGIEYEEEPIRHVILMPHEQRAAGGIADKANFMNGQPTLEASSNEQVGNACFCGVMLESGKEIGGERGFIAFGGNEVKSQLAVQLGIERLENRHIVTDPRTKMTSVKGVWAAGDVTVHSEQVSIALGEGSQAAIWIHKALLEQGGGEIS